MKKFILLFMVSLLSVSCKGQENKTKKNEKEDNKTNIVEEPKGTWKVDKKFDENGNLIRYDSILGLPMISSIISHCQIKIV